MRRREFFGVLSGAATLWPLAVRAQQPAMPVIGWLSSMSPGPLQPQLAAFRQALAAAGFVEGRNVHIEYRWAEGQYDRLPAMAADLVGRRVALLVASGGEPAAMAAKAATSTIPIAAMIGGDPVKTGLVASLNRPGGNVTAVNIFTNTMESKRLGLLHEVTAAKTIAVLVNPTFPIVDLQLSDVREAAPRLGIELVLLNASTENEFDAIFATIAQRHAGGLSVCGDPFFNSRRDRLIALAAQHRVPTIYEWREFALAGGLMSYGTVLADGYRQIGSYASRILKGEKPADLPVLQPTKYEFVINLKTAKQLGVTFSPTVLARADEAIE
jgi:putative tryptophan/tyrosine transport system substrate-binding protein